jgi:type VI secretion system protein ImpG
VTLWPVEVSAATYETPPFPAAVREFARDARALVRLELRSHGLPFGQLDLARLRLFLSGDEGFTSRLHELLLCHVRRVSYRGDDRAQLVHVDVPVDRRWEGPLQPVGFADDEGLLPYSDRSFVGYRLLTEYFSFRRKFLFVDVALDALRRVATPWGHRLELLLFLDEADPGTDLPVDQETFRLGCTPVVNLFSNHDCHPIRLEHQKIEYPVLPEDGRPTSFEVYSIDTVEGINPETGENIEYRPFFSSKHTEHPDSLAAYWHATRRPGVHPGDRGTDVYLSFVNLGFQPTSPPAEIVLVRATCSNRDLPALTSGPWGFELTEPAPVRSVTLLGDLSAPARLPLEEVRWRLLSHLALNHLSIADGQDGAAALRELLRLYLFSGDDKTQQQIEGVVDVAHARRVTPVLDGLMPGFCRAVEVRIEFDEEKYTGSGFFLFASVLERFLGLYAAINSATRLVARSRQRSEYQIAWPYRAGEQTLV